MVSFLTMIEGLLNSSRVKMAIFSVILAFFAKYFPDYAPSEETLNWIYGILVTVIASDTIRPVDPRKKGEGLIGRTS